MRDCTELDKYLTQIAMNLASDEKVKNIDDVFVEVNKIFPQIPKQALIESIAAASRRQQKKVDELTKKLISIKAEAKRTSESVRKENLEKQIKELEKRIERNDILPKPKQKKELPTSKELEQLEKQRDILQDKIKEARRTNETLIIQKFEKQIALLEKRIADGDFTVQKKKEVELTKESERLQYQRDLLKIQLRRVVIDSKPKSIWHKIGTAWDFQRAIWLSGELSHLGRQGGFYMYSHPAKWLKATGASFKYLFSKQTAHKTNSTLRNRELAPIATRAGIPIVDETTPLSKKEEFAINNLGDKLPIVKEINLSGQTFLNFIRAEWFDAGYYTLGKTGKMTMDEAKIWANAINVFTGRGNLYKAESMVVGLNRWFLSARWWASRLEILSGQPLWHKAGKGSWRVRKLIMKEYIRYGIGLSLIYGLKEFYNYLVEDDKDKTEHDLRSSGFGKLKFDKKRLDITQSLTQPLVLAARLLTGQSKTKQGKIINLTGDNKSYGTDSPSDYVVNYIRSRLSPQIGLYWDLIDRETIMDEPLTFKNTILDRMYPMTYGDIYDIMKEDNIPENIALSALAMIGFSTYVYQDYKKKPKKLKVK